ncbi:MAG: hypothetical protein ACYC2H_01415 [Thermoplasmatota archaeon]
MRRFQRGHSTYACGVCSRLTRATGAQSLGSDLCPQCWDLAGIENEISDGHTTLEARSAEITDLVDDIRAKGGNTSSWNEAFKLVDAGQVRG